MQNVPMGAHAWGLLVGTGAGASALLSASGKEYKEYFPRLRLRKQDFAGGTALSGFPSLQAPPCLTAGGFGFTLYTDRSVNYLERSPCPLALT